MMFSSLRRGVAPGWLAVSLLALFSLGCAARRGPPVVFRPPDPSVRAGIDGEAAELLQSMAADVDGPTRAAALEVLVRVSSEPGGGSHGVAAIWDPEPWVQRAAVRALGARGAEPLAVERLGQLAARREVDTYVRCGAALLLTGPLPAAVADSVHAGWTSAPLWKGLPCAVVDAVHGTPGALEQVQAAMEEGALALDSDFVRSLGTVDLDGLDAAMVRGLETADELIRPALTHALLLRGHPAGLARLRDQLSDADPQVRMEAVVLLATVDGDATTQLLDKAASNDSSPEGHVAALVVAARRGASFKVFEEAFASDNRDVRRQAVVYATEHVLRAELQDQRSSRKRLERLLADALVDPDPPMRVEALAQVGRARVHSLQLVVAALLADSEAEDVVRIAAAEASAGLSQSP